MSPEEKLELCRRSYAAFSTGPDLDALLRLYDTDCEWRMGHMAGAISTFHGHDGLCQFVNELGEMFAEFKVEIDSARITHGGNLLLQGHASGRFATTGIDVQLVIWQEGAFRDGRILRVVQTEGPPAGWDSAEVVGLDE